MHNVIYHYKRSLAALTFYFKCQHFKYHQQSQLTENPVKLSRLSERLTLKHARQ